MIPSQNYHNCDCSLLDPGPQNTAILRFLSLRSSMYCTVLIIPTFLLLPTQSPYMYCKGFLCKAVYGGGYFFTFFIWSKKGESMLPDISLFNECKIREWYVMGSDVNPRSKSLKRHVCLCVPMCMSHVCTVHNKIRICTRRTHTYHMYMSNVCPSVCLYAVHMCLRVLTYTIP